MKTYSVKELREAIGEGFATNDSIYIGKMLGLEKRKNEATGRRYYTEEDKQAIQAYYRKILEKKANVSEEQKEYWREKYKERIIRQIDPENADKIKAEKKSKKRTVFPFTYKEEQCEGTIIGGNELCVLFKVSSGSYDYAQIPKADLDKSLLPEMEAIMERLKKSYNKD